MLTFVSLNFRPKVIKKKRRRFQGRSDVPQRGAWQEPHDSTWSNPQWLAQSNRKGVCTWPLQACSFVVTLMNLLLCPCLYESHEQVAERACAPGHHVWCARGDPSGLLARLSLSLSLARTRALPLPLSLSLYIYVYIYIYIYICLFKENIHVYKRLCTWPPARVRMRGSAPRSSSASTHSTCAHTCPDEFL